MALIRGAALSALASPHFLAVFICGPQALADESRHGGLGQLWISYGQGAVHAAGKGHPGSIRGHGEGTGQQE